MRSLKGSMVCAIVSPESTVLQLAMSQYVSDLYLLAGLQVSH